MGVGWRWGGTLDMEGRVRMQVWLWLGKGREGERDGEGENSGPPVRRWAGELGWNAQAGNAPPIGSTPFLEGECRREWVRVVHIGEP
jgi:hypothetical protein